MIDLAPFESLAVEDSPISIINLHCGLSNYPFPKIYLSLYFAFPISATISHMISLSATVSLLQYTVLKAQAMVDLQTVYEE